MNKRYAYFFKSKDENRTVSLFISDVTEFLGQINPSYLDKYGIIHEVYEGKDQPYAYVFEVQDDDFYEVIGVLGQYLDEHSDEHPQDEVTRKAIEEVYNKLLPIAEGKELIVKRTRRTL